MNFLYILQGLVTLLSTVNKTQKDSLLTQHLGDWFPGWSLNIHSHFLHFQRFISFQLAKGEKPRDSLDRRWHPHQTQPVWYFDSSSLRRQKFGQIRTHKKSTFEFQFQSQETLKLQVHNNLQILCIWDCTFTANLYFSSPLVLSQWVSIWFTVCVQRYFARHYFIFWQNIVCFYFPKRVPHN